MGSNEQPSLPSGDGFRIAFNGYARVFDRATRQYGAHVTLVAKVAFRDLDEANRHAPHLRAAAAAATGELRHIITIGTAHQDSSVLVDEPDSESRWASYRADGQAVAYVWLGWRITYKVSRPKQIPDDLPGVLARIIGTPEEAIDLVGATVRSVVACGVRRRAEERQLGEDVALANHLVDYLCKRARRAADDAARYPARLAALQAEYEVEKQSQATRLAESLASEPLTFEDTGVVPERVVQAALKALPAALKGERHGWELGAGREYVSADDLKGRAT